VSPAEHLLYFFFGFKKFKKPFVQNSRRGVKGHYYMTMRSAALEVAELSVSAASAGGP
jgi:hypothetical protein